MTERERRLFLVTFLVVAAAQVVPIWAVRFQPMPDLPTHLAASAIWFHHDDPKWDFARYYAMSLGWAPYWGYHLLVHVFAWLLDVDRANRVVLSLVVVGLPAGMVLLARRFGRSPWLARCSRVPLAWNKSFSLGFVNFYVAQKLLPFAVVAFDWFCERPSWRRGALAAALGTAVFFSHLLPWTMYLGCAGLVGLAHRGLTRRAFVERLLVWLIPALAGLVVMRSGHGIHMGSFNHGLGFSWRPALQSLREMPEWLLDLFRGSDDEIVCVLLAAVWLALQAVARRQRLKLHDLRAEACALVGFVGYLFGPRSMLRPVYWWGINVRFAPLALLFLSLSVAGAIEGRRRWLFAPVAALAIAFAVLVTVHWRRVDQFIDGFDQLSERAAPTDRVMVLAFPPWNEPTMNTNFAQSADAFHQAAYGGYEPDQFDDGFPIVFKQRFPAPPWGQPNHFNWNQHARYYDWLLVFQAPPALVAGHPEAKLDGRAGRWTLWHLPPRVDAPPGPAYPSDWAFDQNWRPPRALSPSPSPLPLPLGGQ